MCGLAGFVTLRNESNIQEISALAARMADTLRHRGPDDAGVWADCDAGIALGHRRLSILDLSGHGHQPMVSATGRYVVAYNGEIYNFQEIRKTLDEMSLNHWRGRSDTEVMLAAFEAWGIEAALQRFVGMFALALWDTQHRALYLIRDRIGEKPLYYGWMGNTFLFASELKALKEHPAFRGEIDRNALSLYVRHNCIPAPHSIYRGISKLLPGTLLCVPCIPGAEHRSVKPVPYWSARRAVEKGTASPFTGNEHDAIDQLDFLLRDAVRKQMVSDVPLGAFLSGGVDSSAVVALMQAQSERPVRTFTIGFHEAHYDEAEHARAVASHLGTDHTELYVTPEEALGVIPALPALYDEPFSDSSQIPTFLVSKLTRNFVTVSLSGDAGDELFAGYNRYFWARDIWRCTGWLPAGLRVLLEKGLMSVPAQAWNGLFSLFSTILPEKFVQRNPGEKLHKMAEVLSAQDGDEMYLRLVSHWKSPASVVQGSVEPPTLVTDRSSWPALSDFTRRMMYLDLVTYLPDDILVKVDRAAMGVSLETRVPFLDHRVVEFAWQLPLSLKIHNGLSKWVLRQVLYRYVPKGLIERPKSGFGVPIDTWLKTDLRDWAENLLDERRLRTEGFFNPQAISQKWNEHLSGTRNWQYHLWDILMFQAWLENQTCGLSRLQQP